MYGTSKSASPCRKNDCQQMDDRELYHRICDSRGPNTTDEDSNPTER